MAVKSVFNSFLFTNEDGSPMVFVISPGDTKKRLRPIVENAGGVVTSKETPGAIRLVAPDYGSGKQLVSSDFVFDSYKNGTLCNIDDYRLESKPDVASPKIHVTCTVQSEKSVQNGRIKYSPEEDQAILDYIRKFEGLDIKLSGNKIWKEMEDKKVTCHRWQSMRSRYLSFLRQSTSSWHKGKLEFVESKSISRSHNANISEMSACKTKFSSHSNVKVNQEKKDKENVHASLPNEQQTITSLKDNSEKSSSGINHDVNILDKSGSSGGSIKESLNSCDSGIQKYFKTQSKDTITSDTFKSGNELSDVPQDMLCDHDDKDNTDDCNHGNQKCTGDCEPVLKCNELLENYKKLQMISQMLPCGTQTLTLSQILHALYVSCGCLECALHFLQTGLLPDEQEIWKREEDTAISSGDAVAIKKIIDKRGQKAVNNRKRFLNSF